MSPQTKTRCANSQACYVIRTRAIVAETDGRVVRFAHVQATMPRAHLDVRALCSVSSIVRERAHAILSERCLRRRHGYRALFPRRARAARDGLLAKFGERGFPDGVFGDPRLRERAVSNIGVDVEFKRCVIAMREISLGLRIVRCPFRPTNVAKMTVRSRFTARTQSDTSNPTSRARSENRRGRRIRRDRDACLHRACGLREFRRRG